MVNTCESQDRPTHGRKKATIATEPPPLIKLAAKRRIASTYDERLSSVPGIAGMVQAPWACSAFWMYTTLVDTASYGIGSRDLLSRLEDSGIQTRPLWQPLHLSKAHSGDQIYDCLVAEEIWQKALSLPCSVGLSGADQARVIDLVHSIPRTTESERE